MKIKRGDNNKELRDQISLIKVLKNLNFIIGIIFLISFVSAAPSWLGDNVTYYGIEDTLFSHNLSANISDPTSDMVFSVDTISTQTFWNGDEIDYSSISSWIYIENSTTGIFIINATNDSQSGTFKIPLKVTYNGGSSAITTSFNFSINATNDAPQFTNLINQSFNMSELFEYVINVTDEENDIPFTFNISFLSCDTAEWSDRDDTNCELFNSSNYLANGTSGTLNISFTPSRNDVGTYVINFTVMDLENNITPFNASTSQIVNFTVLNVNSYPYFTYLCDNERNTSEDSMFSCLINVTDIDEINNLTATINETWFIFDSTGTNSSFELVNSSTDFNASFLASFIPTDREVGNWSINISLTDTGNPVRVNSTVFSFFVDNVNDSVSLQGIDNITAHTTNNYTIYINATDDDLLIPDKSIYNESITFSSNTSWVMVNDVSPIIGTNKSQATLFFDPNDGAIGDNVVNITVRDANNYSIDSKIFTITIINNDAPEWNSSLQTEHTLTEDINFYLNLSMNVSDANDNNLSFSYSNDTSFESFDFNLTTGIINFTPTDIDVGQHILIINVSDGITSVPKTFNFTVMNVNDNSTITGLTGINTVPAAIIDGTIANATEDDEVTLTLQIRDDDLLIPEGQESFYDESLNVVNVINGTPLNFSFSFGTETNGIATYQAIFTPNKSDAGSYGVTVNITDASNFSTSRSFTLDILEIDHNPVLDEIANQTTSINRTLTLDINSTDLEDGDDTDGGLSYYYDFIQGTDFINGDEAIFNTTSGILNFTFNDGQGGAYRINMTVTDMNNTNDTQDFWIFVYDVPRINYPSSSIVFNLTENEQSDIIFTANDSIGNNLTYQFSYKGSLRNNLSYYGNGANITWQFTPNYTDETYGTLDNITLFVMNPIFNDLNITANFSVNISHTNAPVNFTDDIPDQQRNKDQVMEIDLTQYFSDLDASDPNYNQSISFNISSNITESLIDWSISDDYSTLNITCSNDCLEDADFPYSETLNLTAYDLNSSGLILTNDTSNNFLITFTDTSPSPAPSTSSGGGSGSTRLVALNIIVPDPVSLKKGEVISLPIELANTGDINLNRITISSTVFKEDGEETNSLGSYLDTNFIQSLKAGDSQNLVLTVDSSLAGFGTYEINLNASVESPSYSDWGKIYITIEEGTIIEEQLLFTEELIASNPECAEIQEMLDQAISYLTQGRPDLANSRLDEAINACRNAITQLSLNPRPRYSQIPNYNIFVYLVVATISSLLLGVAYYLYTRARLKRAMKSYLRNI